MNSAGMFWRDVENCKMQTVNCKLLYVCNLHFAICILQFAFVLPTIAQQDSPQALDAQEEAVLREAADSVAASVAQIRAIGGLDSVGSALLANGPTTGLVISPDGYIVSSAFNFLQQPVSILVTLASGKQAPAELVATDHSRMLVLLKVSGVTDLPVPTFTPADEIKPGQWAVAIGRTYRLDRINVSVGIVSAVGRMFGKVIQTDADVSTANYGGPLVDIRGRVMGVIVPMAPQGASEVAGAEWYDSGIGFAVPLASMTERLEQMKKGEDQWPGLLGIGMPAKSPHSSPAVLAAVRPDSPAGRAEIKKGDRIVEVNGKTIDTQTDLRFALGPLYGGDTVHLVATRGEERLERSIELVGKLPVFRNAYLGVLPMRKAGDGNSDKASEENDGKGKPERGVVVRMVCDGSPAADAGVRAGDRIVQINESAVTSVGGAIGALNNVAPESEVALKLFRGAKNLELKLTAARMPTSVPSELPPALTTALAPADGEKSTPAKPGETQDLKLPEFPHECKIYLPATREASSPPAALLWLHAPGDADADAVVHEWQAICDRDGMLLILPKAVDKSRWERTELEYLARLMERVLTQFQVDRNRIAVFGQQGGGTMAWLLALSNRDLFRGVATSAAPLPRQIRVPTNEPAQRLAIFAAVPLDKENVNVQSAEGLQKLSEAGYTVTAVTSGNDSGQLPDNKREELARWIDTLDRL